MGGAHDAGRTPIVKVYIDYLSSWLGHVKSLMRLMSGQLVGLEFCILALVGTATLLPFLSLLHLGNLNEGEVTASCS